MLLTARTGAAPGILRRRLASACIALVQSAVLLAAPFADVPPGPTDHRPHLAEPTEPGCQPVHSELDCLLCRVVASSALGAVLPASAAAPIPTLAAGPAPSSAAPLSPAADAATHARAPPRS